MSLLSVFSRVINLFVLETLPGPGVFATISKSFFPGSKSVRKLNSATGGVRIAAGVAICKRMIMSC